MFFGGVVSFEDGSGDIPDVDWGVGEGVLPVSQLEAVSRDLNREGVDVVGDAEDSGPGCVPLLPVDSKGAGFVPKKGGVSADKLGQFPAFLGVDAAVSKSAVLFAVGVKVDAHLYAVFIVQLGYLFFDVVDLRVDLGGWVLPGPVEIETCQVASEVAVDNPVDVEHGEDVEIVLLEQILALGHILLD